MTSISTNHILIRWGVPCGSLILMSIVLLGNWNQSLFLWINQASHFTGDAVWAFLTLQGDEWIAISVAMSVVVWRKECMLTALLAIILTYATTHGLKHVFHIPRPPAVITDLDAFHIIGKAHKKNAFPSGHTATIFTLIAMVILTTKRIHIASFIIFITLGILVGLSRCVVGVHWPVDVLAGISLGWINVLIAKRITSNITLSKFAYYALLAVFLGCTLFAMFVHQTHYPNSRLISVLIGGLSICASSAFFLFKLIPRKICHLASVLR